MASDKGYLDVVQALLGSGADREVKNKVMREDILARSRER